MGSHRVRPNALRHACQIWTYVEPYLDRAHVAVCPGLIYDRIPKTPGRLEEIESILNESGVQVVWRRETIAQRHARSASNGRAKSVK
jgi:hypothetical protein